MQIEDQKSPFYGWYEVIVPLGKPIFQYGFVSKPDMSHEMREWLTEQVGPSGRGTWINSVDKRGRVIIFRNKEKAMLFKLTFA